ncbi:ImmA/IrrE family metallo-endopeptidase [Paenibacillus glucanolyticus]|uniref:ImmA/IrrE family metallo-endopeptidase n=1 Tax=Paenibacillus glucanolyticus TaxID=59843 RepID=UPI000D1AAF73|nr:ImmA/IrrE family metallo-endopeptidase [Paenibacillus glucanolyticus]AVV56385.1 ImmA/IrrE family metallo-endopeptidase [Paenibacillus glucanolyticus]MPY19878.1 ImmA/IrrE family metallo-endopeptidase [Paenibacillus glucanolyticus]
MIYDNLLNEAAQLGIDTYEKPMSPRNKGLYSDNVIWINKFLRTRTEKACAAAEEIGHHHTSFGDILDLSDVSARKQELRARQWGYKRLVPLSSIVQAHNAKVKGRFEIAEYLGVTEEFLQASIDRYRDRFGVLTTIENYIIYLDPLHVVEVLT